ncbi:MAG: Trk system potassium transporter TrkA [Rikenellaceae bacterium]|nr:Trk system potassium transporter TrkA [Rikenellaceae bacterium]
MKIVIAGAGEVGTHLGKMLNNEHHDIIIIDDDPRRLEEISNISDIITVEGDCTTFSVLNKAMVRKADLFIAVCDDENANILASIIAKQLGAKKSIARIDHIEYMYSSNKEVFINTGIDYLFYPEQIAAMEVVSLLGHTRTSEYFDFSGGKLTLVVFKLSASSVLIDKSLLQMTPNREILDYRTVAISRDGETIIPHGNDIFKEGDTIYVITNNNSLEKVMEFSGESEVDINNIMILGGSRIGIGIAKTLQKNVNVKLVDYNQEKAYKLAELLDETLIIHEDGRNTDAMLEEGLANMDAFVAVTGRSETNILTAMLAKRLGVKKVIAEVENFNYIDLAESIGIDTIINKKIITASSIFRFTMNTDVQAIKCLTGSDAEVMEFIAKPNSLSTKHRIRDLDFPEGALIGGIVRGENSFIATGNFEIKSYDRVVVFALPSAISKVGKFFN